MNKLFCILGEMGTGKSTIVNELLQLIEEGDNIHLLKSYTTRPKRPTGDDEYIFVDNNQFTKDYKNDNVLEYATYNTVHGVWHYYTPKTELDLENGSYIKVINPVGYAQISGSVPRDRLVSFRILCDDETRLDRVCIRGDNKEEILRRFETDKKDFAHLYTPYSVFNGEDSDIKRIAKDIYNVIKEELRNE